MNLQLTGNVIKDSLPLLDKSTEGILRTINAALQEPNIVRIVVDAREDVLSLWRLGTDEEKAERQMNFADILRSVGMEEYLPEKDKNPFEQMFEVFEILTDAGVSPSHILAGAPVPELRKWLPVSRKGLSMYGLPLLIGNGLEKDVLVVCGTKVPGGSPEDVSYAVKLTIDIE